MTHEKLWPALFTLQELVAHFQDYSLAHNFPNITTTLKYPYREELARIEGEFPPQKHYSFVHGTQSCMNTHNVLCTHMYKIYNICNCCSETRIMFPCCIIDLLYWEVYILHSC